MHRFTRDVDAMGSGSEAAAVTARRVRTCTHAYEGRKQDSVALILSVYAAEGVTEPRKLS